MKAELVKTKTTDDGSSFDAVMGRLKVALDAPTDAALAQLLGISSSNYANRKGARSIPYDAVISLCISRSVNIDWLFTGTGPTFRDGRSVSAPCVIDRDLLMRVVLEIEQSFADEKRPDQALTMERLKRTGYAAMLYNEVVFEQNQTLRQAMLRDRAEFLADTAKVLKDADDLGSTMGAATRLS